MESKTGIGKIAWCGAVTVALSTAPAAVKEVDGVKSVKSRLRVVPKT